METQTSKPGPYTIPLAIVIAGAMIGGAIYAGGNKQPTTNNAEELFAVVGYWL